MAKRIALFNHKGGVSKTTTAFNLGWKLTELGHRVVLVDTDPQCNLTGLVLGYRGATELESFYGDHPDRNIFAGLVPAFESRPAPITAVECVEVAQRPGLFLLPGSIQLSEYETTLGIAQELTGSIQALQNLPGAMPFLFDMTAEAHEADYVIIDMSPGLGPINQNLLTTSHYFIVPTAPDFFSVMAIDSVSRILPKWQKWAEQASSMDILKDASYPFPAPATKLLGTVVQNYRPRRGRPASSFQHWIDELAQAVETILIPAIDGAGMLLPGAEYEKAGVSLSSLNLVQIPDFNSLVAVSQEHQKPVFTLEPSDIDHKGTVLEQMLDNRDQFNGLFEDLATKVIQLST